ncbi:MAG: prepilin peptidase [Opitutales bacterium]
MLEDFLFVNEQYPWFFATMAFLFGACWGSFANVVIYRVPAGKSIVTPRSHCYACGKPLAVRDNLPIVGWLILRGRARCCGAPFSPRYAIVETLMGALFATCWLVYPPLTALCGFLLIFLLVVGTFIDWDTQELPDFVTVGGAAAGVLLSVLVPSLHLGSGDQLFPLANAQAFLSATLGATVGAGLLLWIAIFAETLLRKEAMGLGDPLLVGTIGAFCGWEGAIFSIFGGSVIGGVCLAILILLNATTGWNLTPGKVEPARQTAKPTTPGDGKAITADALDAPKADPADGSGQADPRAQAGDPDPEKRDEDEADPALAFGAGIPFGPWLAAGGLVYFLGLRETVDAFFAQARFLILGS